MKSGLLLTAFLVTVIGVGCASGPVIGTHPTPSRDVLVEASSPARPAWIVETPRVSGSRCFVGEGQDPEQELARAAAGSDMLQRYAEYLGADFSVLVRVHREEIKRLQDEMYRTEGKVITEAEAVIRVSTRGSEVREKYWEKLSRGEDYTYHRYWVLGEVEESLIKEEQQRIAALAGRDLPPDYSNSGLGLDVRESKARYKAGDTVQVMFSANQDCHVYYLNLCGDGKLVLQYSGELRAGQKRTMSCIAVYGGGHEVMRFVACTRELDADRAMKEVYPASVVENLRAQAEAQGANYSEKSVSILIELR